jgi:hypothetical protein
MGVGQLIRNVITAETDPTVANFTKSLTSSNTILTAVNAASGTISASVLPSYVDDVLNFANLAAFPVAGDAGKIYVTEDNNKTYRWSGSVYVEISSSATAGEALKLTTPRTITTTGDASYSVSFDGSANVTSAITLATVNSNVGSFGSASSIPAITVNAKGQVTAVSTNSIGNELIAIQSLSDTPGFLKKTGDGTYSIDINSYLSLAGGTLTGALIATSFSGVGTALTALNASNISTGTINAARLPAAYLPLTGGTITGDLVSTSATVSTSPTTGAIRGASLGVTGDVNAYTVSASELTVSSIYPAIWLNESKAPTNKKLWYLVVDGEALQFQTRDDNGNYLGGPLTVSRAGTITTTDMIVSAATPSTSTTTGAIRAASLGITGAIFAGSLNGNGSGLTSLNASNISTGTLSAARLPDTYLPLAGGIVTGALRLRSLGYAAAIEISNLGKTEAGLSTSYVLYNMKSTDAGGLGQNCFSIYTYISNGNVKSIPFVILDNDNVGIGTTSPSQQLDVNGSAKATSFVVGTNQVVSARRTGWAAPTGTATRTTFATSTVTLPQLAERVKALIDDLTTHGLIGA